VSAAIPTVGVVEWSLGGGGTAAAEPPTSAKIVYTLKNAAPSVQNRGGEAPVPLAKPHYRTLLLGLKQGRDYTFHIEATRAGATCASAEYALPTTGAFADSPEVTVDVAQPGARQPGFIVTSSGVTSPDAAFILDADGDVVWYFGGPINTTRALLDYEGENMWMIALNLVNEGGQMRYVSLDGARRDDDVAGLENAHHDFTVMPGGKVAALVWRGTTVDPESDVVVRSPDGAVTTAFTVGRNLYLADSFHANAIHYLPSDGGFTIADRNPNVFVKVGATGALDWQVGGSCAGAPAGPRCAARDWQVVHGHHLLDGGTFLAFNNGPIDAPGHVFEFALSTAPGAFGATVVKDSAGTAASNNLGDVQRLPGGHTLVTYATDGKIVELDPAWNVVQTFRVNVGYASWRPTLYGPPPRP